MGGAALGVADGVATDRVTIHTARVRSPLRLLYGRRRGGKWADLARRRSYTDT